MDIHGQQRRGIPAGPVEDATLDEISDTLAIHAGAVFAASQAALPHMGSGGRIISIGSCFAQRVPYGGVTLYAMSKSALIGFTKGLAREVGERGITVNIVDPGSTDTDMNPANGPSVAAELELMAIKRYAQPREIAAAVGYLASAGSQFITGASLTIDGGFTAKGCVVDGGPPAAPKRIGNSGNRSYSETNEDADGLGIIGAGRRA